MISSVLFDIIDTVPLPSIIIDKEFNLKYLNSKAIEVLNIDFDKSITKNSNRYFPKLNLCDVKESIPIETLFIDDQDNYFEIILKYESLSFDGCLGVIYIIKNPQLVSSNSDFAKTELNIYKERLHFFETYLTDANVGIKVYNKQGLLIYLNKMETNRLGVKLKRDTQLHIWDIEKHFRSETEWNTVQSNLKNNLKYTYVRKQSIDNPNQRDLSVNIKYRKIKNQEYFIFTTTEIKDTPINQSEIEEKDKQIVLFNKEIPAVVYQFVIDENNKNYFTYVNDSFEKMFGFKLPLNDKKWLSSVNFDKINLRPFLDSLNTTIKEADEYNFNWNLDFPDGSKKWFQVNALPTVYENKIIYSGIILDITERKNLEIEIIKKQQFNESVLDNIPADIAVFDDNHSYMYINPNGIKDIETRSWLIGKNDFDYCELKGIDTAIAKTRHKRFLKAIQTKQEVEWIDLHHKNNKDIYVLRRFRPIILDGKFVYMIGYGIDVTELKNTQDIVTKNQKSSELILKSALDAIVKFNSKGKIIFWNPSAEIVFGWKSEEVLGKVIYDIIFPKSIRDFYSNEIKEYTKSGKGAVLNKLLELSGIHKYKGQFPVEITVLPIEESNDSLSFCAFIRDISSRIEKEYEINKQNKMLRNQNIELEQFTYITSHDLQEPLLTLMSFSELLMEEHSEKLDEEGNLFVEFINKSAIRMRELITGLMEYARIDKREAIEMVDCDAIVKIVLNDLNLKIKKSKAIIKVDSLPVLNAYPTYLRLLFQNLISNAIKFKKNDTIPEIKITCLERKDDWLFSISDNGIGISEKNKDQIFIIFKRLNNQESYEGHGIGLAHCKKIVNLHLGEIWVDSVKGEGSVFNFTISKII